MNVALRKLQITTLHRVYPQHPAMSHKYWFNLRTWLCRYMFEVYLLSSLNAILEASNDENALECLTIICVNCHDFPLQIHSIDQARLDERVQKIETNLYSANPELRELLDGFCLIDEDREKELRYNTILMIFLFKAKIVNLRSSFQTYHMIIG